VQDAYQDNIDFVHRSWPYVNKLFSEYIITTMNCTNYNLEHSHSSHTICQYLVKPMLASPSQNHMSAGFGQCNAFK
jgi:hypothetical protein